MFPNLADQKEIAIDTETTGLCYPVDYAFCVSIAVGLKPDESWYFDFRRTPQARNWLRDLGKRDDVTWVAHNASFDHRMLSAAGVEIAIENWDDTCVRAVQIDEHLGTSFPWQKMNPKAGYSLDYLAAKYLPADISKSGDELYAKMAQALGGKATRNAQMPNISKAPPEIVGPYAIDDARVCWALYQWQKEEIKRQGLEDICAFERRVMPTLVRAEKRGINVDMNYVEQAIDKLTVEIDDQQKALDKAAGFEVNSNSPNQVKKIFEPKQDSQGNWVASDGTPLESTATGNPSLGADALRSMADPRASQIIELRSTIKTRDTFFKKHIAEREVNGVVYPTINQSKGEDGGTGTGRLSYVGPAMQQIPSRNKKVAAIVKPAFLPPEGMLWMDSDMASFEVRIFAHLVAAYNASMSEAYAANPQLDFHQYVADLTHLPRSATYAGEANAKQLNLAMIFNSGNGAIAQKMEMPFTWEEFDTVEYGKPKTVRYKKAGPEAMKVINSYHKKVQGVKKLAERAAEVAKSRGWIKTRHGRHLRFPKGYKSYKASGLLIQATAADENKENWMRIEKALGNEGHILLNTHDSYSMAVPDDGRWKEKWENVRREVERDNLRVPLLLDFNGVGKNWWEALQKS